MQRPLASVVIGGVISSTLMTMLILAGAVCVFALAQFVHGSADVVKTP